MRLDHRRPEEREATTERAFRNWSNSAASHPRVAAVSRDLKELVEVVKLLARRKQRDTGGRFLSRYFEGLI